MRYTEELGNYGYIEPPVSSHTMQYYCARVPTNCRNELISFLADKGIHTSVHFKPLHLHPLFKQDRNLPVAERVWPKLITLPVHGALTDDDVTYIIECVKEFFDNKTYKEVS